MENGAIRETGILMRTDRTTGKQQIVLSCPDAGTRTHGTSFFR